MNFSHWTLLNTGPAGTMSCWGTAQMLNDREFIIIVEGDQRWIFKYNAILNQWTRMFQSTKSLNLDGCSMAIDQIKKTLYISCSHSKMTIIDLINGSVLHQSPPFKPPPVYSGSLNKNIKRIGSDAAMVNVNGTIHKVGGCEVTEHVTWNEVELVWNRSITTEKWHQFRQTDGALVFVPSKNIILLIGGRVHGPGATGRPYCAMKGIWRCHIENGKWNKINVEFDFYGSSAVLTSDEQNVIIMGGIKYPRCDVRDERSIHILDISNEDEYQIWRSSLTSPLRYPLGVLLARSGGVEESRVLTSGWMRKLCAAEEFSFLRTKSVVKEFVKVISEFLSMEMIHCIGRSRLPSEPGHRAIPLLNILQSTKEVN